MDRQTLDSCTALKGAQRSSRPGAPGTSADLSCCRAALNGATPWRQKVSYLYTDIYIYVIYLKYIEIIIYIYYTLSYNIYIYLTHLWTRKICGDFINGTVLEKCFNFHIPIRWHLISQLVGEGSEVAVSAEPRAPARGHSLDRRGFPWRGPARGLQEGALVGGEGGALHT